MHSALWTRQPPHKALPAEIYLPLVDSLFKEGRTLLLGTIFVIGSVFVTYWKTQENLILYCAIAILIVACARGIMMRAYMRARSAVTTAKAAHRWKYRYGTGASIILALLSIWCCVAFAHTNDAFAALVSFTMTIAYAAGIFGRNFANSRFVIVQILCTWAPMTAALVLYGNVFHWIFAALLIPTFLGIKLIAERLRRTLLDAVVTSRDMSLLAKRFDTALNNMPHGLCMFDTQRRIVVSNQKLKQELGLASELELKGLSVRELVDRVVKAALLSDVNAQALIARLEARLSDYDDAAFGIDMLNGRTLEFTVQPMENGGMVALVEDITERRIAEAKINQLARFDALTGLPNRTVLRDRMERALSEWRSDNMCAIHFIDLDQFKQVNDTLGHTRGDMLLEAVAERLRANIRDADVISRFGGDEFVVLQAPITSAEQCETLANRVLLALGGTYDLDGHKVVVTASIGIAAARNRIDPEQFLRNADIALYQAKAEGRGTWRWFEAKMEANAQARRALEYDLRDATANAAFELYYQPLFNLKTSESNPAKRCCVGRIRRAAWSLPRNSFRLPRRWASSSKSAIKFCTKRAWNAAAGPAPPRSRSISLRCSLIARMFRRWFGKRSPPPTWRRIDSRLRSPNRRCCRTREGPGPIWISLPTSARRSRWTISEPRIRASAICTVSRCTR
jgi:diguanylate cyclase (GGDEF)-like protein